MEAVYTHDLILEASEVDLHGCWKPSAILLLGQVLGDWHMSQGDFSREKMSQRGNFFILARVAINIKKYPTFHQRVRAKTWLEKPKHAIFSRYYSFSDEEGNELITSSTMWMICDVESRTVLTEEQSGGHVPAINFPPPLVKPRKVVWPKDREATQWERRVLYSDLDYNGHMNNAHYADWICDSLYEDCLSNRKISSLTVNYMTEMACGTNVLLSKIDDGQEFIVQGEKEDGTVTFRAKGEWQKENK